MHPDPSLAQAVSRRAELREAARRQRSRAAADRVGGCGRVSCGAPDAP